MEHGRQKRKYVDKEEDRRSSRETRAKRRRLERSPSHRSVWSSPTKALVMIDDIKKIGYRVDNIENMIAKLHFAVKEIEDILKAQQELT